MTLFQNVTLIDEMGNVTPRTDLLVQGGRIAQIGTAIPCPPGAERIDCTGKFLTPGLVVLHTHTPMNIFRGIAEDVNIDDWFNRELWPFESKMTEQDIYWGAKLACAEMAQNGVTAFADHYFGCQHIARAAGELGLRCDLAYTIFGFGGDPEPELQKAEELLAAYAGNEMVHLRIGPHSPYICSPQVLRRLVEAARQHGCGIHLHVSETAEQVKESYQKYGKSPFAVVAEAGGFTVPCIVAHALYIQKEDLPLLAGDTFVAACPKTYLKLGMGEGQLWQHWQSLQLGIGTDGAASSNTIDPLEQVRLFALLGKWADQAEQFTLPQMWQLLFAGHQALPFGAGRLAVGAPADLALWDLDTPATAPVYDPLAAILYSASAAANITHTMVAGRFVKKEGRLQTDVTAITKQAADCAAAITRRGRGESKVYF